MKSIFIAPALFVLTLTTIRCKNEEKAAGGQLKARLETKALCSNYTFTVTSGNIDTSLVAASWTDETTGKTFSKAFGIANPCDFPADIKEGEEFLFTIVKESSNECAVCMAYYPTPPKKLLIKVIPKS